MKYLPALITLLTITQPVYASLAPVDYSHKIVLTNDYTIKQQEPEIKVDISDIAYKPQEKQVPSVPIHLVLVEIVCICVFYSVLYGLLMKHNGYSDGYSVLISLFCGILMGVLTAIICMIFT